MKMEKASILLRQGDIYSAFAPYETGREVHLAHEKHMLPDVLFHERKVHPRAGRWALHATVSSYLRATRGFFSS